jgi:hypothetical protein
MAKIPKIPFKEIIPPPTAVLREGLIVLGGVLIAAYIISKFPAVQKFVIANSIKVETQDGQVLF